MFKGRTAVPTSLLLLILGGLGFLHPTTAIAERYPCGDLVLPYFEVAIVDESQPEWFNQITTAFSVNNCSAGPVTVRFQVWTNWGIALPELAVDVVIDGMAVYPVNLRDWIAFGRLPDRQLTVEELAHAQAALCGEPSPRDGLYYASPTRALADPTIEIANGFVTATLVAGLGSSEDLWGDFFVVDAGENQARGESLVRIVADPSREVCERHLIRFLEAGAFDAGTHFVFWTGKSGFPGATPTPSFDLANAHCKVFDEAGNLLTEDDLPLLPTQAIRVGDLGWPTDFGWVDCTTDTESFVCVDYSASDRYGVTLRSYCEEVETPGQLPQVHLEKHTNGVDADNPTGPIVPAGTEVEWTYHVINFGDVQLTQVVVRDDQGVPVTCPGTVLAPGETMVCTAHGPCGSGQYRNIGLVAAKGRNGWVFDSDPSHCYGTRPLIEIEKYINGEDADVAPGPQLTVGSVAEWTYVVTNVGDVPLSSVGVSDDQGLVVECPTSSLAPNQAMTCTASGIVEEGAYANIGTAEGTAPDRSVVEASDPCHYFGVEVGVDLEKYTNGEDADDPPGPTIPVGDTVTWTYVVTNTGSAALSDVAVTDSKGVAVTCPDNTLAAGDSMTCSAEGIMVPGQYSNVGTVVGTAPDGVDVTATDPSHCAGLVEAPDIGIEKATQGEDADFEPGPYLMIGSDVEWTYVVTNLGDVPLTGIVVSDDRGGVVTCPGSELASGASMTCLAFGIADPGQYANLGSVSGMARDGTVVSAEDPSHYFGVDAGLDLEKYTNGEDADDPTGPSLVVGTSVQWTYVVTNAGNVPLTGVSVADDHGVIVHCPDTTLAVGESMTCWACTPPSLAELRQRTLASTLDPCLAQAGQYENLGTAEGTAPDGSVVTATDPSHYYGELEGGDEGCTPGYWKNHTDSWPPAGYDPGQSVAGVFAQASAYFGIGDATLLEALDFGGGPGVDGAARILLRAAVAALLNAAHPGVSYFWTESQVITSVDAALASGDRDTMLALASLLDQDNNRGCPLS